MQTAFDVAIVGAGASGLAAAQRLQALGRRVVVLEASARVGGRAYTDKYSFSVPFDMGCGWLHQADRNPLTPIARGLGFNLVDHEMATTHFLDNGVPIGVAEHQQIDAASHELTQWMATVGEEDVSIASILKQQGDWASELIVSSIAEQDAGGDAQDTSVLGLIAQGTTNPNWLVQEGMGRVVESLAAGVRVALNVRVSEIESLANGVKLVTSDGVVTAQHCIVTVSTGALMSEAIRFKPSLSSVALSALDALPMGHYNKVILEFDGPLPGFSAGDYLSAGTSFRNDKGLVYLINPFGSNLVVALAGGAYGKHLSTLRSADATQEVLAQLKNCIGDFGGRSVRFSRATDWSHNELFHGAYAYLRTGGGDARENLANAGTDRVHFAGEATTRELIQTCGGAYLTGVRTAEHIDRAMGKPV